MSCLAPLVCGQQEDSAIQPGKGEGMPTIVSLGEPTVKGEVFEWRYQIRNESEQDIWICASMGVHCCEAHLAEDDQTLRIRRRFDLRPDVLLGSNPSAIYVRLRGGQTRTELMSLQLPIQPKYVFAMHRPQRDVLEYAQRAVLEISYYCGDLPGMVFAMLHDTKTKRRTGRPLDTEREPSAWFGQTSDFLRFNEGRGSKSEWIWIPYNHATLGGEQVMRLTAEGLHVSYLEQQRRVERPGLAGYRIEMKFKMSPVDFFFPYATEQGLLNLDDRQYLQSLKSATIKDRDTLRCLAHEIAESFQDAFVWEHGAVELTGWRDDE
jgi:hypothetical protein